MIIHMSIIYNLAKYLEKTLKAVRKVQLDISRIFFNRLIFMSVNPS